MLPPSFFLTGTDTDVGKTLTAAVLCAATGRDYWKPFQAGTEGGTDTLTVASLAPSVHGWPEHAVLRRPASPHAAADDEGRRLTLPAGLPTDRPLLVEGAGGWMVPLAMRPTVWQADLVRALDLPAVIVARTGLGTLNHTALTARAVRADGVKVVGIVLVGPPHAENARDLPDLAGAPVLLHLPWVADPADTFADLVALARAALS